MQLKKCSNIRNLQHVVTIFTTWEHKEINVCYSYFLYNASIFANSVDLWNNFKQMSKCRLVSQIFQLKVVLLMHTLSIHIFLCFFWIMKNCDVGVTV